MGARNRVGIDCRTGGARIFKRLRSLGIDSEESIPTAYVRYPGGPESQTGFSYRPARLGIDSWAPKKV
jgi:hypothetical protein